MNDRDDNLIKLLQEGAPQPPPAPSDLEAKVWQYLQSNPEPLQLGTKRLFLSLLPLAAVLFLTVWGWKQAQPLEPAVEPFVYELTYQVWHEDIIIDEELDYADEIINWAGL
jgi:hypothetical protein